MHTLEQLRSGALAGTRRLDLSAGLTALPDEVFALADTLEVLNLSGNRLSTLPPELSRLHRLKIIFCSDNPFTELPEVLGDCPALQVVGFKACQITRVPGAAFARMAGTGTPDFWSMAMVGLRPMVSTSTLGGAQLKP